MKKLLNILISMIITVLSTTTTYSMEFEGLGERCYHFLVRRGIINQELDFSNGVTRRDFFRCLYVMKTHTRLMIEFEEVNIDNIKSYMNSYNVSCFSDVNSLSMDECFAYSLYDVGLLVGNENNGVYTVDFDTNIKLGDAIIGISRLFSPWDTMDFHKNTVTDDNYYGRCMDYLTAKGIINDKYNPISITVESGNLDTELTKDQLCCILHTALYTPFIGGDYEVSPGWHYIDFFNTNEFIDEQESFSELSPSIYY